jgi:hypothetical protein
MMMQAYVRKRKAYDGQAGQGVFSRCRGEET